MTLKEQVAAQAVALIENNMIIGLGSGTTARIFVDLLGQKIEQGVLKNVTGVPTSEAIAALAQRRGIVLKNLADVDKLDIAVDGADEVDPHLNLMKGWGGALVREKLVELYATRLVIIVDESKLVQRLGTRGPLPVEVTQFGWQAQANWLAKTLGCTVTRRRSEQDPYLTDNLNFILNCSFSDGIADPAAIQTTLADRPGLVGHGLFLNMATEVLVGSERGIQVLTRDG